MATQAASDAKTGRFRKSDGIVALVDRWIYVLMTVWVIAIILAGFVPDSLDRIGQIENEIRPQFTWQAHFHALTMGAWMLLLLAQTTLMATGARRGHMQLGLAGMALAPTMVMAGLLLVPANIEARVAFATAGGAETQAELGTFLRGALNTALIQIRVGLCFLLFVAIAFLARKRDAAMHKRMILLATIVPLGAATSRIPWLPNTVPVSPVSALLWPLAAMLPMLLWDFYRTRSVHRSYVIFLSIYLLTALPVVGLWNSPAWHDLVRPLLVP